ncbi:MAG: tRNA (adenosine(37)-N6)-threonylcarbamoyltransferase complex ATPase subunit type 1 TsaE [Bacteroidetes bacterium]|nr:tRNA (adenosine(37)-N6)-threonylcarbamoyltransferase complex ATPase subunit type 1 TsaE [Bacteroidota bacterium]
MEWIVQEPEAIIGILPDVLHALGNRRKVALYGAMGAGKTTFVRMFCAFLQTADPAASPSFSLVNTYTYIDASGAPAQVHHLDLYRLQSPSEAYDIGLEDLLDDPWYCFIEWPEHAEPFFDDQIVKIQMEIFGESGRRILILNPNPDQKSI